MLIATHRPVRTASIHREPPWWERFRERALYQGTRTIGGYTALNIAINECCTDFDDTVEVSQHMEKDHGQELRQEDRRHRLHRDVARWCRRRGQQPSIRRRRQQPAPDQPPPQVI